MTFYTTAELATRWGVQRATVRWRALWLRQRGEGPTPDQIARWKGRRVAYRADYVALMEARFPGRRDLCPPVPA